MTIHVGDTIVDSVYVEDGSGDPSALAANLVFSAAVYRRPDATTGTPTVATMPEIGNGWYEVSFPTNQAGTFTVALTSSETGMVYEGTYDVDPSISGGASTITGTRIDDFRRSVGRQLRDHLRLRATEDGSESTFKDERNLNDVDRTFRNSHGIFSQTTDPAMLGAIVRVDASSGQNNTLTFRPAFPAGTTVASGDVLDLFNLGGYGFRPQEYDLTMQETVRQSYPDALVEISAAGDAAFDGESPTIVLPDEFRGVYKVAYFDDPYWVEVRPTNRTHGEWGNGWWIDASTRTLSINGAYLDAMDGLDYVIYGYSRHALPDPDDDTGLIAGDTVLLLDPEWTMIKTAAMMANTRLVDARWNNWAVEWGRQADAMKPNIWTPRYPNTVMLDG